MENLLYAVTIPEMRQTFQMKQNITLFILHFSSILAKYILLYLLCLRRNSHVRKRFSEVSRPIDGDVESRLVTWLIKARERLTRIGWLKMTTGVPTVNKNIFYVMWLLNENFYQGASSSYSFPVID